MVTEGAPAPVDPAREKHVRTVTSKALVFGETTARHLSPDMFNDEVMHTYYLFYIFGAIDALGEDLRLGGDPLNRTEKQAAMAEVMAAFGTATREQIIATVRLLVRSADEAAVNIKNAGKDAAIAWDWGDNDEATRHFSELMKNPANFPRHVEQRLQSPDQDAD